MSKKVVKKGSTAPKKSSKKTTVDEKAQLEAGLQKIQNTVSAITLAHKHFSEIQTVSQNTIVINFLLDSLYQNLTHVQQTTINQLYQIQRLAPSKKDNDK